MRNRIQILKLWVDPVSRAGSIQQIDKFIKSGKKPHSVFAVNPEKIFSVAKDPILLRCFQDADLLIPDGIGIIIAVKLLYGLSIQRVTGVEIMEKICALSDASGYRIFLYGATEDVNAKAVKIMRLKYKNLRIVGRSNGYVKPNNMKRLVEEINNSQAEILFLALGSPRQEKWFATHKNLLTNIKVCQGIGGTLDVITGKVKRAPKLWQHLSIEWLYRVLKEPKRIKRQKVLPVFAIKILLAKIKMEIKRFNRRRQ